MAAPVVRQSWRNFEQALAAQGTDFEGIKGATDRDRIISLALPNVNDFERAEIDTEWARKVDAPAAANQDNRIDTHQVLRLLVRNRDHPDPDPHVIDRAIKRFPAYVQLAVLTRDTRLALEVWELADTLPKTETEQSLFLEGIQLDRVLHLAY